MAKIGPKEEQLRALQALRVGKKSTETPRASAPVKVQAAPAAQRKETTMSKKAKTKKRVTYPKTKPAKAASKKITPANARIVGEHDDPKNPARVEAGPREGSKLAIVAALLTRPEGCTTAEILAACKWPTVSVPQQAKAAGLTLRKEKDGKVSRYFGAAA